MKVIRQYTVICACLIISFSGILKAQSTDRPNVQIQTGGTQASTPHTELKTADIYSEGLIDAMKNYMEAFGDSKADNADAIISKVLDTLSPLINDNENIANLYQMVLKRYAALALENGNIERWLKLNKEDYLVTKQWYNKNPEKFAHDMLRTSLAMTGCYIDEHQWDNAEKMAEETQQLMLKLDNLSEQQTIESQFLIDYYLACIWSAKGHRNKTFQFATKAVEDHVKLEKTAEGQNKFTEERSYLEDEILAKCRTGR
mgnify:CR=1 FL=1